MTTTPQTHNIIIYSTPNCVHCHHLKDYLTEKGIGFKDIDVAADAVAAMEAREKSGQRGVPVVDIDGNIVVGFDKEIVDQLLGITN